jgi:uncharacterized membrane protein
MIDCENELQVTFRRIEERLFRRVANHRQQERTTYGRFVSSDGTAAPRLEAARAAFVTPRTYVLQNDRVPLRLIRECLELYTIIDELDKSSSV